MLKSLALGSVICLPVLAFSAFAHENPDQNTPTASVDGQKQGQAQEAADFALNLPDLPDVVVGITNQDLATSSLEPQSSKGAEPPHISPSAQSDRVMLQADEAKLRAFLAQKSKALGSSSFGLSQAKVEGLVQAYASTGYEAFWLNQKDGGLYASPRIKGVLSAIHTAELDGLDQKRLLSVLEAIPEGKIAPDDALHLDVSISLAAYLYAHDARGGRLEPARLSPMLTPQLHLPDAQSLLIRLAGLDNARAVERFLHGYQPRHAGYDALKKQLARMRMASLENQNLVQLAHHSANLPPLDQKGLEEDILVNMERWRWLPPDLGERHVIVNVPAYQLRVVVQNQLVHHTKVIVGRPETPTPVFSDMMEHLIINPSWHVPPSILRKEFLPNLAKDPSYAARKGFEVVRRGNSISVRQPPGEKNALGHIKFIFPNTHSVYLHDTPGRHLFAQDARAFSHGCVRVEAPFRLAERVLEHPLSTQPSVNSEQALRAMVGKGERMIRLQEPLPVHLTYFTLDVDEEGNLRRMKDIYGHDGRMREALLQRAVPHKVSALTP